MANYYATTRSNYFRVKDADTFKAWCKERCLEWWTKTIDGIGECYAITADTGDCCGWPSYDIDNDCEMDCADELSEHLDPRDIAILFEIGSEKLRYLVGRATAIHADGSTVSVSLNDIYQEAVREFGSDFNITEGSY
jgi:hypothetical protein